MALTALIPLFWIALIVLGIVVIQRSALKHKKSLTFCVVAVVLILWQLSGSLYYFMTFPSPEAAFLAENSEEQPLLTVEGEHTDLVAATGSFAILTRTEQGWKCNSFFASSTLYRDFKKGIIALVQRHNDSGDCYILLTLPYCEECSIEDNTGAQYYEEPFVGTDPDMQGSRQFYAYIGTLDEDYSVTVNGAEFNIPSSSQPVDSLHLWSTILSMVVFLSVMIAGTIWIVHSQLGSRLQKALMIFGLLLLSMFLGSIILSLFA